MKPDSEASVPPLGTLLFREAHCHHGSTLGAAPPCGTQFYPLPCCAPFAATEVARRSLHANLSQDRARPMLHMTIMLLTCPRRRRTNRCHLGGRPDHGPRHPRLTRGRHPLFHSSRRQRSASDGERDSSVVGHLCRCSSKRPRRRLASRHTVGGNAVPGTATAPRTVATARRHTPPPTGHTAPVRRPAAPSRPGARLSRRRDVAVRPARRPEVGIVHLCRMPARTQRPRPPTTGTRTGSDRARADEASGAGFSQQA